MHTNHGPHAIDDVQGARTASFRHRIIDLLTGAGAWRRSYAVFSVASLLALGLIAHSDTHPALARVDTVEFVDMPEKFVQIANWAAGLFDEAGLPLPPMRFVHHGDDRTPCSGRRGVHRHIDDRSTIDLCTSDDGNVSAALVLHEVAHAWAAHALTADRKADFQSLRGWSHWRNHEAARWQENGSEQAAENMVWGLIDRPVGIVTIHDSSCADLDAGYRVLTGQPPLHGFRDHCAAEDDLDVGALTPVEQSLVDWATGRFTQAGLELPELTVRFDPTGKLCDNADGLYQHGPNTQRIVTICTPDYDTFAADLKRRRTLLHEFGHAWDYANLSPEDRHKLGRILGTDSWNDHDDPWEDRGVEHLAETFVFALLDQPRRQLKIDLGCADLLAAFRTATGAGPLGPGMPPCAGADRRDREPTQRIDAAALTRGGTVMSSVRARTRAFGPADL